MSDVVPGIESEQPDTSETSKLIQELEARLLALNAGMIKRQSAELTQRIFLKWLAAILGVAVVLGMSAMLWHVIHSAFWGPFMRVSSSFAVAMYLGPVFFDHYDYCLAVRRGIQKVRR